MPLDQLQSAPWWGKLTDTERRQLTELWQGMSAPERDALYERLGGDQPSYAGPRAPGEPIPWAPMGPGAVPSPGQAYNPELARDVLEGTAEQAPGAIAMTLGGPVGGMIGRGLGAVTRGALGGATGLGVAAGAGRAALGLARGESLPRAALEGAETGAMVGGGGKAAGYLVGKVLPGPWGRFVSVLGRLGGKSGEKAGAAASKAASSAATTASRTNRMGTRFTPQAQTPMALEGPGRVNPQKLAEHIVTWHDKTGFSKPQIIDALRKTYGPHIEGLTASNARKLVDAALQAAGRTGSAASGFGRSSSIGAAVGKAGGG